MTTDHFATVENARSLLDLGRPAEALPLLAPAIASDPDDYRARCLLALALIKLDRFKEAAERAREAVAIAPEDDWAYRLLALALVGAKKLHPALEAAERAVAIAPELPEAHITLAGALIALKRGHEAEQAAKRAVELAPESADAHALVGEAALARNDLGKAAEAFRRSLELDPEDPIVQNNLGVVMLRGGRREEAMHLFESAARNDPRADLSRHNLASTARRFLAAGGWSAPVAAFVVLQLVRLAHLEGADGAVAAFVGIGCLVVALILMQVYRRMRERELSPAARALVRDDRRRMRRRPWTWEPSGRWLPLPLWLVLAIPPQVVAALGALALAVMLLNSQSYGSGDWLGVAAVALFTAFFVMRARDLPWDPD